MTQPTPRQNLPAPNTGQEPTKPTVQQSWLIIHAPAHHVKHLQKNGAGATTLSLMLSKDPEHFYAHAGDKITQLMRHFIQQLHADHCTVAELLNHLGPRAFGVVMFVFGVPTAILGGIPGLSTILSIPFFLLGFQMLMGLDKPWIPQWAQKMPLKKEMLATLVDKAEPTLRSIEKLLKPRWFWFDRYPQRNILGAAVLLFSTILALPGVLGNFLPAMGMALIGLGTTERDGACVAVGVVLGILGTVWMTIQYVMIFLLGAGAVERMFA